jgi:membrane protein implicated in regulation of membrane protease activity
LFLAIIVGEFALDQPLYTFMLICMLVIGILSMQIKTLYGLAILIIFILGIAFYNVAVAWVMKWDFKLQGISIGIQTILSFGILISWICGYSIRKNHTDLLALRDKVTTLQKVEEKTGILTFNEFLAQAQLLYTGMKRRNEEGFLIKISFKKEQSDYKARVIKDKLSKVILKTIRTDFDLACPLNTRAVLLYLNNTNSKGVEIVLSRIKQNIEKETISQKVFDFTTKQVENTWDETLSLIRSLQNEG